MVPAWLGGRDSVEGVLQRFIPGQNSQPAALIRLDVPLACDGYTGSIVVLELRHVGAYWTNNETVHVELCGFEVPALAWKQRQQGKWVESHANFQIL